MTVYSPALRHVWYKVSYPLFSKVNCLCRRTFAYAAPFDYDSCVHRRKENSYCDYYLKDMHSMGSNYLRKPWCSHPFWKETSYSADFLLTKVCNENILWIKITFQRKHVNNFIYSVRYSSDRERLRLSNSVITVLWQGGGERVFCRFVGYTEIFHLGCFAPYPS